jgi:hypothetical protein
MFHFFALSLGTDATFDCLNHAPNYVLGPGSLLPHGDSTAYLTRAGMMECLYVAQKTRLRMMTISPLDDALGRRVDENNLPEPCHFSLISISSSF